MEYDFQNYRSSNANRPDFLTQNQENEQRLLEKKKLENKMMDNVLILNSLIFALCLIIIIVFIILDFEIVNYHPEMPKNTNEYQKIGFSLYKFNVVHNNIKHNYRYFCIKPTNILESKCDDLDFSKLQTELNLKDLNFFFFYKYLGIMVIVGLFAGAIINLVSLISLYSYLANKMNLNRLEMIILITKFESILYFITFSIFFLFHFMCHNEFYLQKRAFLSYSLVCLSGLNFFFFRNIFYNKLRIKSLIVPSNIL